MHFFQRDTRSVAQVAITEITTREHNTQGKQREQQNQTKKRETKTCNVQEAHTAPTGAKGPVFLR